MTKAKRPFAVGEKIKFVGWAVIEHCAEMRGVFADAPHDAVVDMNVMGEPDCLRIKFNGDQQGLIHRRQVTHILRKKTRPQQERVELSVVRNDALECAQKLTEGMGVVEVMACRRRLGASKEEPESVHLMEVRPGEVICDREKLAKAWDEGVHPHRMIPSKAETSDMFEALAKHLGLGEKGAGNA